GVLGGPAVAAARMGRAARARVPVGGVRGAPRLGRGAPSVGGLGGHIGAPNLIGCAGMSDDAYGLPVSTADPEALARDEGGDGGRPCRGRGRESARELARRGADGVDVGQGAGGRAADARAPRDVAARRDGVPAPLLRLLLARTG